MPTHRKLHAELAALYESVWGPLLEIRERRMREAQADVAWPMLVGPTEAYTQAEWRIVVIGRETAEWSGGTHKNPLPFRDIEDAMKTYALFLQTHYRGAWRRALVQLHEGFTPALPRLALLTTNLFRMDENGGMPSAAFQAQLAASSEIRRLVERELAILRPHIAIFAAGVEGEQERLQQFPRGASEGRQSGYVERLHLPDVAPLVYRITHHPAWLARAAGRLNAVMNQLIQDIKTASPRPPQVN